MNTHIFNGLPIPSKEKYPNLSKRLIEISGRLASQNELFREWAKEVGVQTNSVKSEGERSSLIYEANALAFLIYGLDRNQMIHVYKTFHRGWNFKEELNETLEYLEKWGSTNE
jgi:hypothetical protein